MIPLVLQHHPHRAFAHSTKNLLVVHPSWPLPQELGPPETQIGFTGGRRPQRLLIGPEPARPRRIRGLVRRYHRLMAAIPPRRRSSVLPATCRGMAREAETAGKVIAIVDDDGSALAAVAGLVRALGFAVAPYSDPEAFLRSGTAADALCLIVDMQMPRMTGLELHRRLAVNGTPLRTILMTAFPDEMTRRRAHDAGVECFLTKPLRPDAL